MNALLSTTATRRTVLVGAGAAGVLGATEVAVAAPRTRRAVVGVLTSSFPGRPVASARGRDLVAGLRTGLGSTARRVVTAEVPFGYAGAEDAARRLLDSGADVLVASVGEVVVERLAALCAGSGTALVAANVGAHVVTPGRGAPTVLHSSMQHWAAALSLGGWAARTLGGSLHAVVSAPDAGYDSVFALRRGFTAAGGTVTGLSLTHEGDGVADLVAEVRASAARVVGVSASGRRAVEIVRALRGAGVRLPLLVDSLALESGGLAALGDAARNVYVAGARLDAERHAALRRALRAAGAGAPTSYSVLGHDTGLLVAAGAARLGSRSWERLPRVLAGARVRGVRGQMRVHPSSGTVSTPLVVSKVRARGARVVAQRPRVGGVAPAMAVVTGRHATGYVNEYQTT